MNIKTIIFFFFLLGSSIAFSQLSVERIWKKYEFYARGVDGFASMADGQHYTNFGEDGSILKFNINNATDAGTRLVSASELLYEGKQISVSEYEFNADESKLLLLVNKKSVYRHSYRAQHFLFDLKTRKLQVLDKEHEPQTLAKYSPDGKSVSYIHGNDLFVKDLRSETVKKLTKDGKKNKIINGTTDWVYEEEFALTDAYAWSPDGKYIAFLRFDERNVPEFNMAMYGSLYPEDYKYKYPKAGEVNSVVTAHVVEIKSGKIQKLDLGEYEYIPRLNWSGNANLLVLQTMNRHQSQLKYHLFDFTGKKSAHSVFYEEKSKTYIDIDDNLAILKDGKSLIRTSEMNGYRHLYKLSFDGKIEPITTGNWDVIDFLGIDNNNEWVYYTSAEVSPKNKTVYRIRLNGSDKTAISPLDGYNDAEFTEGMNYFVLTHSDANTVPTYVLCDNKGSRIRDLEMNVDAKIKIAATQPQKKEFLTFKSGDIELNGWMIKPKNFDPSKKYPVYMTVYGGPGHNEVLDQWDGNDYMYHQLLAENGYIVVCVDPRGTQFRGEAFKKSTYLQLGKLEIEDVINSAKELQKLPYVDGSRIGIMGWSYGGFMASLAITKGADVFKMAIAVAPVTNWRYYDNIYTERFMRTPQENADGYDKNSPINYVDKIKGNYFLIHGSADDNVHYQNAMEMVTALVKANKQFDMFIYPNKNHGIYGGNTRNHLFQMLFDYTLRKL
ncbi:MAG: hypothetical protein RL264_686 [Bacteroidota bacterium]|jgi:dipeptidyl-peptidase-4